MAASDLSRRGFLQRFVAVGAVSLGSGSILAACGGGETTPQAAAPAAAPNCSDVSALAEADRALRTQLQYTEVAVDPAKHCSVCALYVAPAAGVACGGCTLIKGPIAPAGSCLSWAAKAT